MNVVGGSHISFSVSDLARPLSWYEQVFGAEVMMREPGDERAAAVLTLPGTSLLVGLVEFSDRHHEGFDPTRTGLDHFAYAVNSKEALEGWAEHLDQLDIEHSGALDVPPGAILNFKDPDGIALALFWRRS